MYLHTRHWVLVCFKLPSVDEQQEIFTQTQGKTCHMKLMVIEGQMKDVSSGG